MYGRSPKKTILKARLPKLGQDLTDDIQSPTADSLSRMQYILQKNSAKVAEAAMAAEQSSILNQTSSSLNTHSVIPPIPTAVVPINGITEPYNAPKLPPAAAKPEPKVKKLSLYADAALVKHALYS